MPGQNACQMLKKNTPNLLPGYRSSSNKRLSLSITNDLQIHSPDLPALRRPGDPSQLLFRRSLPPQTEAIQVETGLSSVAHFRQRWF